MVGIGRKKKKKMTPKTIEINALPGVNKYSNSISMKTHWELIEKQKSQNKPLIKMAFSLTLPLQSFTSTLLKIHSIIYTSEIKSIELREQPIEHLHL